MAPVIVHPGRGVSLMPEWLRQAVNGENSVDLRTLAARLAAAFLLGCVAASLQYLASGKSSRRSERPLRATLVLLSVLLAMVTLVIGDNLARAFGLVGALSIVRFRTVVADTRDTA